MGLLLFPKCFQVQMSPLRFSTKGNIDIKTLTRCFPQPAGHNSRKGCLYPRYPSNKKTLQINIEPTMPPRLEESPLGWAPFWVPCQFATGYLLLLPQILSIALPTPNPQKQPNSNKVAKFPLFPISGRLYRLFLFFDGGG